MPTSITESAIRAHLHTAVFGKTLIVEPQLPSTNDTAKELAAADAPEGTVVVAAHQTAGRGRREHTFFSPTGGVYLSLILRPASPIEPGLLRVSVLECSPPAPLSPPHGLLSRCAD